jgi:hypothetical protein
MAEEYGIELSDFDESENVGLIDLVIGEDLCTDHFLLNNQLNIKPMKGIAFTQYRFGWTLRGCPGGRVRNEILNNCAYLSIEDASINFAEEFGSIDLKCVCQNLSRLFVDPLTEISDDMVMKEWNDNFQEMLVYDENEKRYTVPLPWNGEDRPSPNYKAAVAQCFALKTKLKSNGY